ncbi:MAG: universal stress protein [Pseudomonadota bacterium]
MSHGIRRILCCVGLRTDSDKVLAHAVGLAVATGAKLDVLHAVKSLSDDVVNTLRDNIPDRGILESLRERRLKEAGEVLDDQIETFWSRHPDLREAFGEGEMTRSVLEGYPASVITDFATDARSDMIVLAANKRNFSATYAGKITKGVIKRSRVPVVVVPPCHE